MQNRVSDPVASMIDLRRLQALKGGRIIEF
jgi:hypothetical protein